ncbi:hypothetical protein GCM10008940_29390 [Microbulbifer agarilyticus]
MIFPVKGYRLTVKKQFAHRLCLETFVDISRDISLFILYSLLASAEAISMRNLTNLV